MRYEGDAEIFYKIVISNIFVLSYALTYKYELTLMVGASLGLAGRYEPYRLICQCHNIKRQVGVLLGEHRGWILRMAFSYKAKNISYNSTLSYALTYSNQLSTIR